MLSIIYNIAISLYGLLMNFVGNFHPKAKKWKEGRQIIEEKYKTFIRPKSKLIWIHCASLGEFEQGRPLIEALKRQKLEIKILLTFFSPSGYEIRKNYELADYITYLPIDTPKQVNRFLDVYKPDMALFVKYEFWRNFIAALKSRQIPIYSFSTIFRPEQIYFKVYGHFFRETLLRFNKIFVQDQVSFDLLKSIQFNNAIITGDTRFDRVFDISKSVIEINAIKTFKDNKEIIILGSIWPEDMEILIPFINRFPNYKFIVAPHEINATQIETWQKDILGNSIRYSEIEKLGPKTQVLFIDNIGMLSSLYQYAEFAFIGGAFGKGLHNTLEAATFGMPLMFGNKNYSKFKEANDMIALKTAFAVKDYKDLIEKFSNIEDKKQNIKKVQLEYVASNIGSSQKIISEIGIL